MVVFEIENAVVCNYALFYLFIQCSLDVSFLLFFQSILISRVDPQINKIEVYSLLHLFVFSSSCCAFCKFRLLPLSPQPQQSFSLKLSHPLFACKMSLSMSYKKAEVAINGRDLFEVLMVAAIDRKMPMESIVELCYHFGVAHGDTLSRKFSNGGMQGGLYTKSYHREVISSSHRATSNAMHRPLSRVVHSTIEEGRGSSLHHYSKVSADAQLKQTFDPSQVTPIMELSQCKGVEEDNSPLTGNSSSEKKLLAKSYKASITLEDRLIPLGVFRTLEEAARAHDQALIRGKGPASVESSELNYPVESYSHESLDSFTRFDVILRHGMFGSAWSGLKECDFTFLIMKEHLAKKRLLEDQEERARNKLAKRLAKANQSSTKINKLAIFIVGEKDRTRFAQVNGKKVAVIEKIMGGWYRISCDISCPPFIRAELVDTYDANISKSQLVQISDGDMADYDRQLLEKYRSLPMNERIERLDNSAYVHSLYQDLPKLDDADDSPMKDSTAAHSAAHSARHSSSTGLTSAPTAIVVAPVANSHDHVEKTEEPQLTESQLNALLDGTMEVQDIDNMTESVLAAIVEDVFHNKAEDARSVLLIESINDLVEDERIEIVEATGKVLIKDFAELRQCLRECLMDMKY